MAMVGKTVDDDTRDIAITAKQRIDSHTAECERRWTTLREDIGAFKIDNETWHSQLMKQLICIEKKFAGRWWVVLFTTICGLGSFVAGLIYYILETRV